VKSTCTRQFYIGVKMGYSRSLSSLPKNPLNSQDPGALWETYTDTTDYQLLPTRLDSWGIVGTLLAG
jgi:hypothetical protein